VRWTVARSPASIPSVCVSFSTPVEPISSRKPTIDEGCRLPLNIGFLPLPVDPISKAMTHPLRSTGITPLQDYKETDAPPQLDSNDAAMTYERFIRCGSAESVANYYEAVRPSPAHQYFRPRGLSHLRLVWGFACQGVSARRRTLIFHQFFCSI
jgi:hypothetical protein